MATSDESTTTTVTARQRKAKLQGWVSRVTAEARQIISSTSYSHDELVCNRILGVKNNLRDKFTKYKAACEYLIELTTDDEELRQLFDEVTAFDTEVETLLLHLESYARKSVSSEGQYNQPSTNSAKMKLPKLQLKQFSGDTLMWPEFWDLFEVAVHNNGDIATVQKFVHLKSLLTGEAAKCIASIPTTEHNYAVALDRLHNRYAKKEAQRHNLMLKLSEMKNLDSFHSMREAVDELTATIRALQVQGVTTQEYGALLMPLIEARMPKSWKLEWARKKAVGEVTFEKLIDFLEMEVEVREMVNRDYDKYRNVSPETDEEYSGSATALQIKSSHVLKCTFCAGPHKPVDCEADMSVDERFNKIRELKACFRCALPRHRVSNCRWKVQCRCGRLHIPQLCMGPKPNHTFNTAAASFHPEMSTITSATGTSSVHQAGTCGLRMRTLGLRFGQIVTRALCDTGSTYSLMSSRLAQSVPHQVLGRRKLRIQTFGNVLDEEFEVIRVTAQGLQSSTQFTFDVLVTDAIIGTFEQIDYAALVAFRNHFGGQELLADAPGDASSSVDMIIGEDYYDTVVLSRTVRIQGGLKATSTIFGWMLHGGKTVSTHANSACVFRATVQEQLSEFWNLEHLGVSSVELGDRDIEVEVRNNMTRDESGRYVVEWPWKPHSRSHLALNREVSAKRLTRLLTRMTPDECAAYDCHIQQLQRDGYIEPLPEGDMPESYLPHRGVLKTTSTTTKLRIVYDA